MIACLLLFCLFISPFSDKNTSKVSKIPAKNAENNQVSGDIEAVIVMYSRDNCPPCLRWWEVERPRWEAVGWSIDRVTDENTSKLTPWYEIHDGDGQQFEVLGYLTTEKFRKAKEGVR